MKLFGRGERSPTPLRTNYDFTFRHERVKMFLRILSQCDANAAKTAQVVRDLISTLSQVSQSYYEVSLCVNNVNPSTASILQARRAPADEDVAREAVDDKNAVFENRKATGTTTRTFDLRHDVTVARQGGEGDIGYQDGVVTTYGAGLQTAAKVFASEVRALKEGKLFAEYSEGIHHNVLAQLKDVETKAKAAVASGNDTEKHLKAFLRTKKCVALKEKKYVRLGKPLSQSKKYTKQVAAMQAAEQLYKAKLASFDERYEHLFQRDLYVTGHSLDSFLNVNFVYMAHLMQVIGSVAPNASETMKTVVVDGGDELGRRMGIAEEERIGSKIRGRRGGGEVADAVRTPARAKAEAGGSHNFTTYFSTRRPVASGPKKKKVANGGQQAKKGDVDSVVDVDGSPPTAKNNDDPTRTGDNAHTNLDRKYVGADSSAANKPSPPVTANPTPVKLPPPALATAKPTPVKQTPPPPIHTFTPCDNEPEPRRPQQPHESSTTPDRANNAPFGDTPSAINRAEQARLHCAGVLDANTIGRVRKASHPMIVKRNPTLSPSREPYGYPDQMDEVRGASVAYTACSRVVNDRTASPRGASPLPLPVAQPERRANEAVRDRKGHPMTADANANDKFIAARQHTAPAAAQSRPAVVATAKPTRLPTTAAVAHERTRQPEQKAKATRSSGNINSNNINPNVKRRSLTPRRPPQAAAAVPVVSAPPPDDDSDIDELLSSLELSRPLFPGVAMVNTTRDHDKPTKAPKAAANKKQPKKNTAKPTRKASGSTNLSTTNPSCSRSAAGAPSLSGSVQSPANTTMDAATAGRLTIAASVKGLEDRNGSFPSFQRSISSNNNNNYNNNNSFERDIRSGGLTPQGGHAVSGTSTPPPPPFYAAAWETMNLAK